jgi:hypothetical protein
VTITSNAGGAQAAVDDADDGDVVVVDSDQLISEPIEVNSNVTIRGGGGRIKLEAESNADALRLEGVENVDVRGLHIDGNGPNQGGGVALIGGRSLHDVRNLRVTGCRLTNAPGNAISLHIDRARDTIQNIYIGGNYIENARRHGILIGASPAGEVTDVLIENNRIVDWSYAQAIGAFAQDRADTHGIGIVGNRVEHPAEGGDNNVATLVLEERVRNSLVHGNVIDCPTLRGNGPVVTKDTRNNLVSNNVCNVGKAGLGCINFHYYEPDGPPIGNVFTHNHVTGSKVGIRIRNCGGGNAYWNNSLHDCETMVRTTDSDQRLGRRYLSNNGPAVSLPPTPDSNSRNWYLSEDGSSVPVDVSTDGAPQSVSYTMTDASVSAEGTWYRGSKALNESVSVTVSTTVPPGD